MLFQTPTIDIKTYLSSGQHGNDPAKIKAMLEKMRNQKKEPLNQVKEDEDEEVRPKDLFSKYKSGKSKGSRYGGSGGYTSSTEGPEDFTTTSHHHHNHNHKTWEPPGI